MKVRKYGNPPFSIVLVHGGPGAGGEMAPVARTLASSGSGVLEPFQTALSLKGQLEELKGVIEENASPPVFLAGFSWGAWLSLILAAEYPGLVRKLILVGSGAFEEKYVEQLNAARMARLSDAEKKELDFLVGALNNPGTADKTDIFRRFGSVFSRTDSFSPVKQEKDEIDFRPDIFNSVWPEAAATRKSGGLLKFAAKIKCPVTAIHGDYDPSPYEGVRKPLADTIPDFKFILLEKCGHKPWTEQYAAESFYRILRAELEMK